MKQNSKRLTSIIIAALFLVFSLIVYLEFIVPAYTNLQDEKGQAMGESALLANEKQVVSQVQSLITTYQGEASSTQSVNMALPVGQNVADALAQVFGIATNAGFTLSGTGITVQSIQPTVTQSPTDSTTIGSVAATGGSIVRPAGTVTFAITGSGSYESFNSFLQGLENNIRLFDVTGISIQPAIATGAKGQPGSADFFNYTITVVTYYQSS